MKHSLSLILKAALAIVSPLLALFGCGGSRNPAPPPAPPKIPLARRGDRLPEHHGSESNRRPERHPTSNRRSQRP